MFEEDDNVWSPHGQNVWGEAASSSRSNLDRVFGQPDDEREEAPADLSPALGRSSSPPRALVAEPDELPWDLGDVAGASGGFPGGFPGSAAGDPFASENTLQQDVFHEATEAEAEEEDDFGDFGDVHESGQDAEDDDGFGDFEESEAVHAAPVPPPVPSTSNTRPIDMTGDIAAQAQDILNNIIPLPPQLDTSRPERQLFGTLEQHLISDSSRRLYADLISAPTESTALQWKRSKTRQAYFSALGIPLDVIEAELQAATARRKSEAQPRASTSSLAAPPPHPSSRPSTPSNISTTRSAPVSRAASPAPPPPTLDRSRAQKLIGMSAEELNAQPLDSLREIQEELESLIKVASAQLTHGMDMQEKLAGDAQTYDRMIQDLVSTAQKLKPAASSTVSMSSNSSAGKDLKRSDSLPQKRSSGLWGSRSRNVSGQQPSSLRKASMH